MRAALDTYGVPYKYFGENAVAKMGDLRAQVRRDHLSARRQRRGGRAGVVARGAARTPIPYKKTAEFPALGFPDSTDDIRGALGDDGMKALYAFVQQGGTLITEGSTSGILPEMNLTPGVTVEPAGGAVRARHDPARRDQRRKSPLVYGYEQNGRAGVFQIRRRC